MPLSSELPPVNWSGVERAVLFEQLGELQALLEPQAALDAVGHVELRQHRHLAVSDSAHRVDDPSGERGAVLDASAELVAAPVEVGAEERAQQVVVAEVDLERVEPGFDRDAGCTLEVGHDLVEVSACRALDPPLRRCAEPARGGQARVALRLRLGDEARRDRVAPTPARPRRAPQR
jgi:hypothetical protein